MIACWFAVMPLPDSFPVYSQTKTNAIILYSTRLFICLFRQGRARVAFEKERDKLKEFIAREGRKLDNPAHQAQRKMKMKQLEQLQEVDVVEEDSDVVIRLPRPYGVFDGESLVGVSSASFAWPGEESLFEEVDFSVRAGARLAIMGKNGCGKHISLFPCHPSSRRCHCRMEHPPHPSSSPPRLSPFCAH